MTATKKLNAYAIKWIALLIVAAILFFMPTNDVFTSEIKIFVALTVSCIGMFALQLFDSPLIPSLILMFGYTPISDLGTIMGGWSKDAPWIVMCVFVIVAVMNKTPLLRRVAYRIVLLTGGSYVGICVGFYLVGLVLSLMGDSPCIAIITVAFGVVTSLKLENKKAAAGIMLCSFHGIMEGGMFVFSPTVGTFLYGTASSASELVPATSSYFEWFRNGAIYVPYYILLLAITILIFRPKDGLGVNGKAYFREELEKLGPMSKDEIKIGVIVLVMFVYLLTNFWHGYSMLYGFVAAVVLLFVPGIQVGNKDDIKQVNFAFPIFIVACLAIGNVANALGVGQLLADLIVPVLDSSNVFLYLLAIAVFCFLLNFVMTPMAVFSSLLVPLTIVTMSLPNFHDVFPLLNAILIGVGNLLLPHATTNSLILYSFGVMPMKDFLKGFGIKAVLSFAWLFVAVLYWKAIGLLG